MSAIAGLMSFGGQPIDRENVERMIAALRPYGPDRSKVVIDATAGLGHALMRMTPEDVADAQPLRGTSGALLVADLRLDNRKEMIGRLGIRGEEAATWPDARIVLAAWERWQDRLWADLRGPFAVAIWDPARRVLTLARDHLGLNAVMYHRSLRAFAFATMPRGLFALPWIDRELNPSNLADFLVLNHADLASTPYKDVLRVLPAHVMKVSGDGSIRIVRYWSPEVSATTRLRNDDEYAAALREVLGRAVLRQMRSAGPIGSHLTGGLDSSSVSVLAASFMARSGHKLRTFTHVPREGFEGQATPGWYVDERPFVEEIASFNGNIIPTFVASDQGDGDDFDELERFFYFAESPVRNVANLGWMLGVSRAARRQGCRVLLGGQFGNLTISWSGWSQIARHARHGRLITASRQLLQFYLQSPNSLREVCSKLLGEPLAAALQDRMNEAWRSHSAINPDFARSAGVWERSVRFGHDFRYRLREDDREYGLSNINYFGDLLTALKAATGVEIRDPTADIDVVSYCLSIPPQQYLSQGIDRSLIRRAMRSQLPERVISNRSTGQQSSDWYERLEPRREWLSTRLDEFSSGTRAHDMIDLDRLRGLLASWPKSGWHTRQAREDYQLALTRAVGMGLYLKWFDRAN